MDLELRIKNLEKEIQQLKETKCPLCGGKGYITTPSGINDLHCHTCSGTGKIKNYNEI